MIHYEDAVLEELCKKLYRHKDTFYRCVIGFISNAIYMFQQNGAPKEDICITISYTNLRHTSFMYQGPDNPAGVAEFCYGLRIYIEVSVPKDREQGTFVHNEEIFWKPDYEIEIHHLIQKVVNIKTVIQKLSD